MIKKACVFSRSYFFFNFNVKQHLARKIAAVLKISSVTDSNSTNIMVEVVTQPPKIRLI
jgi:hypothetical protein